MTLALRSLEIKWTCYKWLPPIKQFHRNENLLESHVSFLWSGVIIWKDWVYYSAFLKATPRQASELCNYIFTVGNSSHKPEIHAADRLISREMHSTVKFYWRSRATLSVCPYINLIQQNHDQHNQQFVNPCPLYTQALWFMRWWKAIR